MVHAELSKDSIQIGTKVFTVVPRTKLDKYGNPKTTRVKNDIIVLEAVVQDITFTMRYENRENTFLPAVMLTLAAEELVDGLSRPYYRHLQDIPNEECFMTREEALKSYKERKGE